MTVTVDDSRGGPCCYIKELTPKTPRPLSGLLRVAWRPPRGNDAKHQTRHRFMCPLFLHPDDLEPLHEVSKPSLGPSERVHKCTRRLDSVSAPCRLLKTRSCIRDLRRVSSPLRGCTPTRPCSGPGWERTLCR